MRTAREFRHEQGCQPLLPAAPVSRSSTLVCDGDDHDFFVALEIDNAEMRRPCSDLPLPREDNDSRSLQALARFGHHLITGNRFNLAAEILRV
ncbi:MAG TPA: hypothetical protein VLH12_07925, partial [Usitatibacter sp.]|nr:hypothetical protein [Usitatibacter sp.]